MSKLFTFSIILLLLATACAPDQPPASAENQELNRKLRHLEQQVQNINEQLAQTQAPEPNVKGHSGAPDQQSTAVNPDNTQILIDIENLKQEVQLLRNNPDLRPTADNICQRSPRIQDLLIEKLRIPSCRIITGEELTRITKLEVYTATPKPGDLDGLHNLTELSITTGSALPPAFLQDHQNLVRLTISLQALKTPWDPAESLTQPMPKLTRLNIDGGVGRETSQGITLTETSLSAIPNLQDLTLEGVREIHPDTFKATPELKQVQISAWYSHSNDPDPQKLTLPPGLLSNQTHLRAFSTASYKDYETFAVASPKITCYLNKNYKPWPTVGGQLTKVITQQSDACRVGFANTPEQIELNQFSKELLIDMTEN